MVVEAREGAVEEGIDMTTTNNKFPLFGHEEITMAIALLDGVNLFAARMDAFDTMMQSVTEHYKLKHDLVENINRLF